MTDTPTAEEQTRFYLEQSIKQIGYKETIEQGLGDGYRSEPANDDFDTFVRNLEVSFHEGVRDVLQNKRELGHSPLHAWLTVVDEDWPVWVQETLAEQEYRTFGGKTHDRGSLPPEDEEYVAHLEAEYDVPK